MPSFRTRIFSSAAFFGAIYGYQLFDKTLNYAEVEAFLESIDTACHLEKVEGAALQRQRTITEQAPCHVVEPLAANHPGYADYNIIKTTYYTVSYKDSSGQWQMGKLTDLTHHDGREMKIGEKTSILMHKADHKKIRKI